MTDRHRLSTMAGTSPASAAKGFTPHVEIGDNGSFVAYTQADKAVVRELAPYQGLIQFPLRDRALTSGNRSTLMRLAAVMQRHATVLLHLEPTSTVKEREGVQLVCSGVKDLLLQHGAGVCSLSVLPWREGNEFAVRMSVERKPKRMAKVLEESGNELENREIRPHWVILDQLLDHGDHLQITITRWGAMTSNLRISKKHFFYHLLGFVSARALSIGSFPDGVVLRRPLPLV